jgi:hypothetical protein
VCVCVCVRARAYIYIYIYSVGCATTNDATTNECYNESIKSEYYNERGGIISADVARACAGRVGPFHVR